jgi:hypothetical protein
MSIPTTGSLGEDNPADRTILFQSAPDEPEKKPRTPRDYDKDVGDRVEKKPRNPESPQQTHENEDHG